MKRVEVKFVVNTELDENQLGSLVNKFLDDNNSMIGIESIIVTDLTTEDQKPVFYLNKRSHPFFPTSRLQ